MVSPWRSRVSVSVFALEARSPTQFPEATTDENGAFAVTWTFPHLPVIESVNVTAHRCRWLRCEHRTTHAWSEADPARRRLSLECRTRAWVVPRLMTTAGFATARARGRPPHGQFLTNVPGSPWQPPNVRGPAPQLQLRQPVQLPATAAYGARTLRPGCHVPARGPLVASRHHLRQPGQQVAGQSGSTRPQCRHRSRRPFVRRRLRFYEPLGELSNELGSDTTDEDGLASVAIERDRHRP